MFHASKRSKFNGTLLLTWVAASCLLSGIAALPCTPTSTTCGCSPEIAELKSLLLAKLDKVEAKVDKVDQDQQVLSEFVGVMPPSTPPSVPPSTPPSPPPPSPSPPPPSPSPPPPSPSPPPPSPSPPPPSPPPPSPSPPPPPSPSPSPPPPSPSPPPPSPPPPSPPLPSPPPPSPSPPPPLPSPPPPSPSPPPLPPPNPPPPSPSLPPPSPSTPPPSPSPPPPSPSPPPPMTGTVVLDFTKGILPANMVEIPTNLACSTRQSVFEVDPHMGNVYRVEDGTGFYIPGITDKLDGKVEAATEYTIRIVLKLDKNSGWNRILNVNPGHDHGFYILDGANWYPSHRGTPQSPTFPANEWHSVTISTGPDQNAAAYLDGGSKAEWLPHDHWSTACRIVTSSFDVMMFFNDGGWGGVISCVNGGEHTGLHVKSIQVFNKRLTDSEVAQLEVDNPVFPAV